MRDDQAGDPERRDLEEGDRRLLENRDLSERDRRILDFEQHAPVSPGRKEAAIRRELGFSAARYQQLLGSLIEEPAALAYAPMLVGRLQRLRDSRSAARRSRTFGHPTR